MAHVLLGWELGANRGHIERLLPLARALSAAGHWVTMALQQIDTVPVDVRSFADVWQAPLWPRLIGTRAAISGAPATSMGDITGRLGLDQPGCLAALIAAWDQMIGTIKPDQVVADFAPALLCAARGRVPTISVGTGFSQPPAGLARFPTLTQNPPAFDEAELLRLANADLALSGRAALPGLPALFAADTVMIAEFAEIDGYGAARTSEIRCAPSVRAPLPLPVAGGDELFIYGYAAMPGDHPLWAAIAASRVRVRLHMAEPNADHIASFAALGFAFEASPLPFTRIAAQSRAALGFGGHGFVSACLLAGLPQLIISLDLEKAVAGDAIARGGWGVHVRAAHATAAIVTAGIDTVMRDAAMAARTSAAAIDFHARMRPSLAETLVAVLSRG